MWNESDKNVMFTKKYLENLFLQCNQNYPFLPNYGCLNMRGFKNLAAHCGIGVSEFANMQMI